MTKQELKKDLLKINAEAFISFPEICSWLGRSEKYVRKNITDALETEVIRGETCYYVEDVADAVMSKVKDNRKFRGKGMDKKSLVEDIKITFGSSFVSVGDLSKWTGRSRSFVKEHITSMIPSYGDSTHRIFFAGDVADRMLEIRGSWRSAR